MEIVAIGDTGPCWGVEKAILEAEKAHGENPGAKLFFSHPLVHNKVTNERVEERTSASALPSFKDEDLDKLPENALILFSAHGHPIAEEEALKRRGIAWRDSFCPLLSTKYRMIEKSLANGDVAIFVGKQNHQETLAALSHFPLLWFIDASSDPKRTPLPDQIEGKRVSIFRQSTLILYGFPPLLERVEARRPKSVFLEKACPYLTKRFTAIADLPRGGDKAFVVVGDPMSSNAHELLDECRRSHPESYCAMVEGPEGLAYEKFKGASIVYVLSATSTLSESVESVLSSLRSIA